MNRYLEIARKFSHESTAKHQRMCALIVRGGSILSVGINHKYNHAERRAIRPHVDYSGATIFVMRHNGRCSRPCDDCQRLIIEAGIKRAVYVSLAGTVATEMFCPR